MAYKVYRVIYSAHLHHVFVDLVAQRFDFSGRRIEMKLTDCHAHKVSAAVDPSPVTPCLP